MTSYKDLLKPELLTVEYVELYQQWHRDRGIYNYERTSIDVMRYVEQKEGEYLIITYSVEGKS